MNKPRGADEDYIQFLIASPITASATEAARVQSRREDAPAHDAFTRLLHRLELDPAMLWREVEGQVERRRRVLVVDDSTLDKPYAHKVELVHRHWSGTHHAVVDGINLITLLWTDGAQYVPCDWRVFDKPHDGETKNDHLTAMLLTAKQRGFQPECVLFDSWYAGIDNLRLARDCGWRWLTQFKSNRRVNVNRTGYRYVRDCAISETGTNVWLEGYRLVRVFRIVAANGEAEYWATSDTTMNATERLLNAGEAGHLPFGGTTLPRPSHLHPPICVSPTHRVSWFLNTIYKTKEKGKLFYHFYPFPSSGKGCCCKAGALGGYCDFTESYFPKQKGRGRGFRRIHSDNYSAASHPTARQIAQPIIRPQLR